MFVSGPCLFQCLCLRVYVCVCVYTCIFIGVDTVTAEQICDYGVCVCVGVRACVCVEGGEVPTNHYLILNFSNVGPIASEKPSTANFEAV